jgi:hypothetical protein
MNGRPLWHHLNLGDYGMNDAKTILNALKDARDLLKLIRNLHSTGELIPDASEWINKGFIEFLDNAEGRCERAIGLLEGGSQWGGASGIEPGSGTIH